jgi:Zn finger protein HypA/HybF involved in hydrogenase expression
MYAKKIVPIRRLPILHECQNCEMTFSAKERASRCPNCDSNDRSNLIILHMEEDSETAEWLAMIDFSAGD